MKYICLILFLLASHTEKKYDSKDAIIFEHTGDANATLKTLIVSLKKIDIQLHNEDYSELKRITRKSKFTKQEINNYLNLKYNLTITNNTTFFSVVRFLTNNKQYYINNSTRIDVAGTPSYHIIYNGMDFQIYSKLKMMFFNDLKNYLNKNGCDKKVIQSISKIISTRN